MQAAHRKQSSDRRFVLGNENSLRPSCESDGPLARNKDRLRWQTLQQSAANRNGV